MNCRILDRIVRMRLGWTRYLDVIAWARLDGQMRGEFFDWMTGWGVINGIWLGWIRWLDLITEWGGVYGMVYF